MYPLKMTPVFKELLWGGEKLRTLYSKDIPCDITGESWEVSCHENGKSTIANGKFANKTLDDVLKQFPHEILGTNGIKNNGLEKFPLLFKLIDANDALSVQVHPEDDFAKINENGELGKTELWYVLNSEPGSKLIYGVAKNVTVDTFKAALLDGSLENQLNYIDVKADDVFFIPAGTIHAIGKGIVIAEIQQNSDTTYRVYDYNRKDSEGNERTLHISKALSVSSFADNVGSERISGDSSTVGDVTITKYVQCDYFTFEKIDISNTYTKQLDGSSFEIIFFSKGEGTITSGDFCTSFKAGDTFVIPATLSEYTVVGKSTLLKSYID